MFPYYYKNGELFGVHFGSFHDDEKGLLNLMKAEEEFFRDQNRPLPFWADFYETRLTETILTEFLRSMSRLRRLIPRLAIVGCTWKDRWRIGQLIKKKALEVPAPIKFYSDPEEAKTWLVSER
jgi:hypothetical protein